MVEAPVGAFPVSSVAVDRREPTAPPELPPPSPVLAHKPPNGSSVPRQHSQVNGQQGPAPIRFSFSVTPSSFAAEWQPILSLDTIAPGQSPSTLKIREIFPQQDLTPVFQLEREYMVRASLPRSFYMIMAQNSIKHCCVFEFPVGDKWWGELSGLRKVNMTPRLFFLRLACHVQGRYSYRPIAS